MEITPEEASPKPRAIDPALGPIILLLILIQLFILMGQVISLPGGSPKILINDASRYHQIANEPGVPYRDFQVEFPPITLVAIELLDASSVRDTAVRLAWFSFGMQLACVAVMLWAWGRRAAYHYLVFTLPLVVFLFFRIDLLSVALAAAGLALAVNRRERLGGAILAASVLAKGWALILIPFLLIRRLRSALIWFTLALAIGGGAWLALGGFEGIAQVVTFRHARGWHIYSTPGILTILLTGAEPHMDAGSSRVGFAPLWARLLLLLLLAAYVAISMWRISRRSGSGSWSIPAGNVAALLFLAPIVSEQYISWLAPWVAIAAAEGNRRLEILAMAISILTAVILFPSIGPALLFQILTLVRNLLLAGLALLVIWQPQTRELAGASEAG